MANLTSGAEAGVIKAEKMTRVRELDFVLQFAHNSLGKLLEVLGVTRKIPMMEGTTLNVYETTGTLEDGEVPEGDVIPLSEYKNEKKPVGEITLKKWRKAVTAEAIKKSGYDNAVRETDAKMLKDIQNKIRGDFFTFLNGLSTSITGAVDGGAAATTATGTTFQAALANAWGKLQTLFEDDTAQAVYFVNPEDVSDYLGTAAISTQTAFGMNYIENFLGLGTVIMTSRVEKGKFIATAKENIILYYLTMNGDISRAFSLTADDLGLIGMKSGYQNEERAQIESLAMSGIQLLVEYSKGVVAGTISPGE